jgi:hypothetical protein
MYAMYKITWVGGIDHNEYTLGEFQDDVNSKISAK